ncbi:hypothetical protein NUSPORA_00765 [Nucleospora cyclopteri]
MCYLIQIIHSAVIPGREQPFEMEEIKCDAKGKFFTINQATVDDVLSEEFWKCLVFLTESPKPSDEIIIKSFDERNRGGQVTLVAKQEGKVVGTASMIFSRKFIRNCAIVGMIEDVVVHEQNQGYSIGQTLVNQLLEIGKQHGIYKAILSCDLEHKEFYAKKCGFNKCEISMKQYFVKELEGASGSSDIVGLRKEAEPVQVQD